MTELTSSIPLQPEEGTSDVHTLGLHPDRIRSLDLADGRSTFLLYIRMNEFINATGKGIQVRIREEGDCGPEVLKMQPALREKLGNPGEVKLFRKDDHLFLKPLHPSE